MSRLTIGQMSRARLRHGWRVSASVMLGVATATAVIVGALLVGDSMRGSLRSLTIQRLGRIDSIVAPGKFFDPNGISDRAIPLVLFSRGVAEFKDPEKNKDLEPGEEEIINRAGSLQIIGCDSEFWDLDSSGVRPTEMPGEDTVVLNQAAADELDVKIGDEVTVRLPVEQAVPADSPLGRRETQSEGLPRMKVVDILPDRGLGRFAIAASQAAPKNLFLSRALIGEVLERDGQANMLLFDRPIRNEEIKVDLADIGLKLDRITRTFDGNDGEQTIYDYYSLTSDHLLLPDSVVNRLTDQLGDDNVRAVTTYLANAIDRLDESGEIVSSVLYSTVSAMRSSESLPLNFEPPADIEIDPAAVPIVLNSWTSDQLGVQVGAPLRVAYYEPEVENGKEIERYFSAVVTQIVPLTIPKTEYTTLEAATFDQPPTVYNDPDLTPTVPGVTDQRSINEWDLPFKLTRKVSDADDDYWNQQRLTPKAFLPLKDGRRLFGSRFGHTTSLRITTAAAPDAESLRQQIDSWIEPLQDDLGWSVLNLRDQQLAASRGTTPFDVLFLLLSMFVIFSAIMLIAMLFRLGLVQRLPQFGMLLAIGWLPARVVTLARREGMWIALVGSMLGIAGGILYSIAVLAALRSAWVGAVTVPFLRFHWTPLSLIAGAVVGWIVAVVTLNRTAKSMLGVEAQTLLSGRDQDDQIVSGAGSKRGSWLPIVASLMAIAALGAAAAGAKAGGQAAAGGFVGGGMLLLMSALTWIYHRLRKPRRIESDHGLAHYSIGVMSRRNATRHPLRSTMTIGLMATASFLIIAISAFRLEPNERGTGGFELIGQTAQPLYRDLEQTEVQSDLLGPDAKQLADATIIPIRVRLGQDASCNNLYQATQPTIWGLPQRIANWNSNDDDASSGFQWAATAELAPDQSPWSLLEHSATGSESDPIPVVMDQNTAMYSLQMYGGIGQSKSFEYEPGQPIWFQVVGLLSNSLLQGRLLIGNDNFEQHFTAISGYQAFLISCPANQKQDTSSMLESRLGDFGMDVSDTSTVLAGMLAVQNTYLRTFQSLGALGLLLGTIGLAIAQLRSVLERRSELAVLSAIGFTRRRLAKIVMNETVLLLVTGIGCGAVCAFLAVLPHALFSDLNPPILEPLGIVVAITLFGMLAAAVAVGRVMRMPLIESLRSD